jgi:hypothetical protein
MPNVVEYLRQFRNRKSRPPWQAEQPDDFGAVLGLSAREFAGANLAILVRSYLLGEDILLVSNDQCRTLYEGNYVTYLPEELQALYQLSPDHIERIHRIKKLTDGDILSKGVL